MAEQAPARKVVIGADRQVHRDRLFDENALFAPLLRDQRQAAPHRVGGIPRPPRLAVQLAALHPAFAGAEQRFAQLGFARPGQPGDPQNFPLTQAQRDILQQRLIVQPFHLQQHFFTVRQTRRREDIAQLVAQHLFDNLFPTQRRHRAALNQTPVAQHRQGVADRLQLVDAVRNKHHPDPLLLQTAYHRKQAFAFMLIQRRGGFIEDQKAAMVRQGAGQQDLLFFGERAAVNRAPDVQRHVQLRQRLARQLPNPRPAEGRPRLSQPVQHDVFGNAQARHQRHVHLLLHQVDPQLFGIPRRTNGDRLVVDRHLAFIVGVGAAQHGHQRRLTRAVGAGQGMHRPAMKGEGHLVQRLKAGEGQANVMHLKAIRAHHCSRAAINLLI